MRVLSIASFALAECAGVLSLHGAFAATCAADSESAADACYTTANNVTNGDISSATCDQLDWISNCFGLAYCDSNNIESWYMPNAELSELWTNKTCTSPTFGEMGTARSALAWGDPHYIMFNGTYASCQNYGGYFPLASGVNWRVSAAFSYFNESISDGTVITQVAVFIFHPAYPSEIVFSLDGLPTTNVTKVGSNEDNWLTVTEDSVGVPAMGLKVFVTRKSGHFQVGVVAKTILSGQLLTGCPFYDPRARSFDVAAVPTECEGLPAGYQEGCVFDLARSNGTWASEGASDAQQFSSVTLAAEVSKQNGDNFVCGPSSIAAIAVLFLVAVASTMI